MVPPVGLCHLADATGAGLKLGQEKEFKAHTSLGTCFFSGGPQELNRPGRCGDKGLVFGSGVPAFCEVVLTALIKGRVGTV